MTGMTKMKIMLFTISFIMIASLIGITTSSDENALQEKQAGIAKRTLLQLMINQESHFCREGRWNENLPAMYPEDDLDTSYYRYSMDTLHFVILAERRDYEQGSQIPQYIAVGRSGRFLKDPRPYVQ